MRFNRSALSACAVALAAVVLAAAPVWANAQEPQNTQPKSTPVAQMDTAKMDGMKDKGVMATTGDVDHDFAVNMRKHHQMAVEMSQAELKNGKDPQLLRMAKNIIAAQTKEIAVLDRWLEAHKKGMPHTMPNSQ